MNKISRLLGIFTRSENTMASKDSSPPLQTSFDLPYFSLSSSPSPTKTGTDDPLREQTPEIPPRIRPPKTQENPQQLTQLDIQPALPARRIPQPPSEYSK